MWGRYTTIVADLTNLAAEPLIEMSLCNVGIMGTKYIRNTPPPSNLEITKGAMQTLTVEKIIVKTGFEIGNTLSIKLRQKVGSELPWVTITPGTIDDQVDLNTAGISAGDFSLILESFDDDSTATTKSVLDTLVITVQVKELVEAQPAEVVLPPCTIL